MTRVVLCSFLLFVALTLLSACEQEASSSEEGALHEHRTVAAADTTSIERLEKSKEAWRRLLSSERYQVLFEEATEPPFSSPLLEEDRAGTYICAACHLPLFRSETKFESGTGWPSFYEPIEGHIGRQRDTRLGHLRTEYHCARCGGHQGHVFDDGPEPTGQRWCNNGLALKFVPDGEPLPELRS